MSAVFPMKREDGSFAVSARFSASQEEVLQRVDELIATWVRTKSDEHIDWTGDLVTVPTVKHVDKQTVEVVFDGKPGSRRWKDWMVSITQQLSSLPGMTFEGFFDLVANVPHPASLPRRR